MHSRARQHLVDLPVNDVVDDLKSVLVASTTALLIAPPGAGKTTTVPLHLLNEPWMNGRKILMLEPRRLATRAAAQRMAHTTGTKVGSLIGYQTRDDRVLGADTRIEVITEGILTRRMMNNPTLDDVGLVIFDEVHERNLPTDLGIALTLDVMRHLRPDLRLLAMSATPDARTLVPTLKNATGEPAPIIESLGRQHEVTVVWDPKPQKEWLDSAVTRVVIRALNETEGDVLVFLPGMGEINRVRQNLNAQVIASRHSNVQIHRLAGALSQAEQDAALQLDPLGQRRVILSTDIAETSLTVDGVTVVVDAGLARVPRFDSRTGMTRLTTIPCSRANAEQRAGRAGRTQPGTVYRLWSKIEHGSRRAHLAPEITETELTSLALDLIIWGTDESALSFPDPPPKAALKQARELLQALGAIDEQFKPTELGRDIAALPVHPRLAAMIQRAKDESADDAWTACIVATLVEERDILRGQHDSLPIDLALRVDLVAGHAHHDTIDRRAVENVSRRASDLARRAGVRESSVIAEHCGQLLLGGFPDRLATKRSGVGQFQLRGGSAAWVAKGDNLAESPFIVAIDLDGDRKNARVRLAASVSVGDIEVACRDRVRKESVLIFDKEKDDFVLRTEVLLDNMRLLSETRRPEASVETLDALIDRVRTTRLAALKLSDEFRRLQRRMQYVRGADGETWPDWTDAALIATLELWLLPYIGQCRDLADMRSMDLVMVLQSGLSWDQSTQFSALAPTEFSLPNGRVRKLEYPADMNPLLRVRVQDLYGVDVHPAIVNGKVPLVLELLSPADRPIQTTSDLPGFWKGSWRDVRKDMAGRYPKHSWPEDPATAKPPK